MKVLHSWLKEYVGDAMPAPQEVERLLTFHAFEIDEVTAEGEETVIDVKVLPDRAADSLSHRGIARELATHIGVPLAHDPFQGKPALPHMVENITVRIEGSTRCRRYMAASLHGVRVTESPAWLKKRLEALGQRSINNIVDATNYVMLALGQPLHAYDVEKISEKDGVRALAVRMAHEGEVITILGGEARTLSGPVPVIADGHTDAALGIAGVKGGVHAEIAGTTTAVILEAANFDPQLTRKAAQALKLPTDAAKRFENNLSPEIAPYALAELIRVVLEVAGGTCDGYVDMYTAPEANSKIMIEHSMINARLGLSLDAAAVTDIFTRLGFHVHETGESWQVEAPFERRDIHIPEDLIEEVGRVYGYEHVASVLPSAVPLTEVNPVHYYGERIRAVLHDAGFSEIITSSFRKRDEIELQNALASDKGCLRSTLRNNLSEALDRNMPNADLLGRARIQIFEIGTVFEKTRDGHDVTEHLSCALGVRCKQQGYSPKDDVRLLEIKTLLESALGTSIAAQPEKGVLEFDMSARVAALPAPAAYEPYVPKEAVTFKPYSAYPFVSRDIALWAPEGTSADDVHTCITREAGPLLISVRLFDMFAKDGRVSYAFRLIFQSFERTLTDVEVGESMDRITKALLAQGFEVR
jgi:phenylalanyl-tRNA synthetase beta chain